MTKKRYHVIVYSGRAWIYDDLYACTVGSWLRWPNGDLRAEQKARWLNEKEERRKRGQ